MDTYGLIGFPLTHSFSAKFFTEKFCRENIDAEYLNFEIRDIKDIHQIIQSNRNLKGLNVTIPHKENIIPFLDEITPEAQQIGAVNVIKVEKGGEDRLKIHLTGYNTDYIGFRDSLLPLLSDGVKRKALILGTGGASKAVAQALTDLHIEWLYVSRTPKEGRLTYDELSREILSTHTLIVNASPVGTFPETEFCPDIPYSYLTPNHLLYDLIYNPAETLFLRKGKERGATIKNGKEMLELQALAAWHIWNQ